MASEFDLKVDITAETAKLEAGMRSAEQTISDATQSIEEDINSTGDAFDGAADSTEGFADKAVKVLAAMGAIEGGIKLLNAGLEGVKAAMAGAEGDTEAMNTALTAMSDLAKSLPFGLGAIASAIEGLADSIMGVTAAQLEAQKAQERLVEAQRLVANFEKFNQILADGNSDLRDRLAMLNTEDEFAKRHNALTMERFRMEEALQKLMSDATEATGKRRVLQIEEIKERMRLIDAIIDKEKELNMQAADKAKAEERARLEQERQLKLKEAQEKLERERLAREKELERIQKERMDAEKELLEARQAANESIAGATGSFATAGGAFTAGVDAQLQETKLMRSVSEKSRDILQQIKETLEKRQPQPMLM